MPRVEDLALNILAKLCHLTEALLATTAQARISADRDAAVQTRRDINF